MEQCKIDMLKGLEEYSFEITRSEGYTGTSLHGDRVTKLTFQPLVIGKHLPIYIFVEFYGVEKLKNINPNKLYSHSELKQLKEDAEKNN